MKERIGCKWFSFFCELEIIDYKETAWKEEIFIPSKYHRNLLDFYEMSPKQSITSLHHKTKFSRSIRGYEKDLSFYRLTCSRVKLNIFPDNPRYGQYMASFFISAAIRAHIVS